MLNARDPQPINQQTDLFTALPEKRRWLNAAMDRINEKYGQFTLMPAKLLNRSSMPDVISPAWKPTGHRRTI
jgi:DNA polymerase-4